MTNLKTLDDNRNILYAILKEDANSSAYPYVLVDALMNWIQQDICSGVITDLTSWRLEQLEKWPLPFLNSDEYYTSVSDIYLDTDATIGWITLSASNTSNYADSWNLWINEDIIAYTWNTWTWFTWVTWIDFAHKGWARVSQLFELPSDYATSNRVIYNNQITLKNKDYRDIFQQLNNYKGSNYIANNNNTNSYRFQDLAPFYTIINWTYFLPFQIDETGYMYHIIYEKKATTLTDWTDTNTIPDNYSQVTIPILAAADLLYNRWEENRALQLHRFTLWKVKSMYSYFQDTNNEDLHNQRISTWKDQILNI